MKSFAYSLCLVPLFAVTGLAFQGPATSFSTPSTSIFSTAVSTEDTTKDPFEAFQPGSELAWKDIKIGEGEPVEDGDVLTVSYTGVLFKNRREFGGNEGLKFKLGGGTVMPGFEQGVVGIKEGGVRKIRIPPSLAYGDRGAGNGKIPPNSDLEFEIEVKSVARGFIAGNIALAGENRLIIFVFLLAISIFAPMIGVGERGFI